MRQNWMSKLTIPIVTTVILVTGISGCVPPPQPPDEITRDEVSKDEIPDEKSKDKGKSSTISSISLLKKVDIDTGARPEVVATEDRVFVIYLTNFTGGEGGFPHPTHRLKIFNNDLTQEIVSKDLVYTTSEYGRPVDIRITSDDNYLYAFYETVGNEEAHLWGAKYTLDDDFEKVAYTAEPIAIGPLFTKAKKGEELVNDPIPLIGPDSVFVITRTKQTTCSKEEPTIYRVREFSFDFKTKLSESDLDLSSVADGPGRQASAIYYDGHYYMVVPSTSEEGAFLVDVITPSDLVLVKLDTNWNILKSKVISQEPGDVENFVTGFQVHNGYFFISYKQGYQVASEWAFVSPLKVYDQNLNLAFSEIVKKAEGKGESLKSSLEVTDDRVYIGYSAGQGPPPPGLSSGQRSITNADSPTAVVYMYEINWKEINEDGRIDNLDGGTSVEGPSPITLEQVKSLQLTDEYDGYGARPEIVSHGEYFYIIYLGDITGRRTFKVRTYDMNFNLIKEKVLVSGSLEYGDPTDIRISKDGDYVYAFYELSSKEKGAHLFGAKYKLDEDFTKVAESRSPIVISSFFFDVADGEETLNDPASVIVDGRVYVMTKIKDGGRGLAGARTAYRVRELSSDLSEIVATRDIDLSETMDGWATLNNLFYANGEIHHIQSSITSFSPKVNPDLKMVRFDKEWKFDRSSDVFSLTNANDVTEGMPTGVRFTDNLLFLSHRIGAVTPVSEGAPTSEGELWLNIYNDEFELIDSIRASSKGLFGEHSTVAVVGNHVYVAYGGKTSDEARENIHVDIFKFRGGL